MRLCLFLFGVTGRLSACTGALFVDRLDHSVVGSGPAIADLRAPSEFLLPGAPCDQSRSTGPRRYYSCLLFLVCAHGAPLLVIPER